MRALVRRLQAEDVADDGHGLQHVSHAALQRLQLPNKITQTRMRRARLCAVIHAVCCLRAYRMFDRSGVACCVLVLVLFVCSVQSILRIRVSGQCGVCMSACGIRVRL